MDIELIHKLEKATVDLFNMDGWNLEWKGGDFAHYDAIGTTPKGKSCVIEMKFRKKYYETKLLEVYKYEKMIEMNKDCSLYFVNDPKGNYLFWLNDIDLRNPVDVWCPNTTLWGKEKKLKPCYMIEEKDASIINKY